MMNSMKKCCTLETFLLMRTKNNLSVCFVEMDGFLNWTLLKGVIGVFIMDLQSALHHLHGSLKRKFTYEGYCLRIVKSN